MPQQLTSHSPDLRRLRDEGYEVEVRSGRLLVGHVPYVTSERTVQYGTLVSELSVSGDVTTTPSTHVAQFCGATPCDAAGRPLDKVINGPASERLADGTEINFTFSSKPLAGYPDYYAKMTTYVAILAAQAQLLDPSATATTFPVVEVGEDESVFRYLDTATSRSGIDAVTRRLERPSVAIVGLGGTGAYILDLVAKTPVEKIHLFDGDRFLSHNAFRAPGAPSIQDLRRAPSKVSHLASIYSNMHRGIVPHEAYIDESNVGELRGMDFVFMSLDRGAVKRLLVERLEQYAVAFVDVGMGVYETGGALAGLLRVTTSTPQQRHHVHAGDRIPYGEGDGDNDYARNIQIADLNALNAALAVVKWKKHCGFYADLEHEHFCVYQVDGNELTNEDTA